MRKILLLIFVIFITIPCNSQKNSYLEKNFTFIVELYPSFTAPCRIIFQNENNSKTLSVNIFYDKEHLQYLNDKNNLTPEKTDILLIDDWFKKYLGDTVYVYFKHLETIQVVDNEFQNFVDSLYKIDLTKQKSLEKEGIYDGIDVAFRFKTDSIDNCFNFQCPDPEDSTEFTIIKAIFNLLEHSYKLESTNNHIETLKGYFDFGLCVKHISDNPLEYRFYSHLSENDEFYNLMESLPRDKPVIFDFSNFGRMGTMFYDYFEDFIEENPNVYWIVVNNYTIKQINEIGVKRNRIFNNRNDAIKVIKRKKKHK
ncbi:MAG: hypothetical protein LBT56_01260 [Prevotellaceae bacterium]|jgi:hypothetical protein|nr:hypothetical protein [Prevotellaceae bacterium]